MPRKMPLAYNSGSDHQMAGSMPCNTVVGLMATKYSRNLITGLTDDWAYHILYHTASFDWRVENFTRMMVVGTFKHWDINPAEPTWLSNTKGSANQSGLAQIKPLHTVERHKVPTVCISNTLRKYGLLLPCKKAKPFMEWLLHNNLDALGW